MLDMRNLAIPNILNAYNVLRKYVKFFIYKFLNAKNVLTK